MHHQTAIKRTMHKQAEDGKRYRSYVGAKELVLTSLFFLVSAFTFLFAYAFTVLTISSASERFCSMLEARDEEWVGNVWTVPVSVLCVTSGYVWARSIRERCCLMGT